MKIDQTVVCILGMHRSGTSCLAGCLQDCGLYLGDVVNEAPHNLKGNKENLTIRAINDRVLATSNASWDHPPEKLYWDDELRSERDKLLSNYANSSHWGFKDPRTMLTLPFWLEALPQLSIVGTFRHPLAVARSHFTRDRLAIDLGLKLWKSYNSRLLEYIELYDFPLVCFDWPEDVYKQAVVSIANKAGLNRYAQGEQIPFYESSLRRQNSVNIEQTVPQDILNIYESLCSKARKYMSATCDDGI